MDTDRSRSLQGEIGILNAPVVRSVLALATLASLVLTVVAIVTGRPVVLIEAATAGLVAIAAAVQVAQGRERARFVLWLVAVAVTANVTVHGTTTSINTSTVGLVVIGIGILLLTEHPKWDLMAFAAFLVVSSVVWRQGRGDALVQAILTTVVAGIAAAAVYWIRVRLAEAGARHRHLFERAPVSIWLEDFTDVATRLEQLRGEGVTDLARHFADHPDEITACGELIEIVAVNQAAVDLLEVADAAALRGRLDPRTFTDSSIASLVPQFLAVWEGRDHVVTDVRDGRTLRGARLDAQLSWTVPRIGGRLDLSRVVVAIVDTTQSIRIQEQLEALLVSKDELVAAVSHELRTPLTAVVGLAHELESSLASFDHDELVEFVGLIAEQSRDVSTIVDDLLAAARAEDGSLHVEPLAVRLDQEAASTLKGLGLDANVPLTTLTPAVVRADPGRLRQIVRNLVINAQRYGEPPLRIVVGATDREGFVEVRDAGPPLSAEQRVAIFERYHRERQPRGVTGSVGLGLTVSRQLARVMAGDVTYDHDGEAVFRVSLPLDAGTDAEAPQPAAVA